jgi:hypothetical protein
MEDQALESLEQVAALAGEAQLTLLLVQQLAPVGLEIRPQQVPHKEITEVLLPAPVLILVVEAVAGLLRLAVTVVGLLAVTAETVLLHLLLAALLPTQVVVVGALLMVAQRAPAARAVAAMQEQAHHPQQMLVLMALPIQAAAAVAVMRLLLLWQTVALAAPASSFFATQSLFRP